MDDLNRAFAELESIETSISLNTAGGVSAFLNLAQTLESIETVLREIENGEKCLVLLKRIVRFYNEVVDYRYENKWDVPLALYTWLLSIKNFSLGVIAAEIVIKIPNCWWASRISRNIILGLKSYNESSEKEFESLKKTALSSKISTPEVEEIVLYPKLAIDANIIGIVFPQDVGEKNEIAGDVVNTEHTFAAQEFSVCNCENIDSSISLIRG